MCEARPPAPSRGGGGHGCPGRALMRLKCAVRRPCALWGSRFPPPTHHPLLRLQAVAYEFSTEFGPVLAERMAFFGTNLQADTLNRVKVRGACAWAVWRGRSCSCVWLHACSPVSLCQLQDPLGRALGRAPCGPWA